MSIDIILSKVPMPHGKNTTFIMRVDNPKEITWNKIFDFCEERSKLPRRFIKACNFDGKMILGKIDQREPFDYDKFRLRSQDGKYIKSAFISMGLTPWGNN